jgi:hypothetical protein
MKKKRFSLLNGNVVALCKIKIYPIKVDLYLL